MQVNRGGVCGGFEVGVGAARSGAPLFPTSARPSTGSLRHALPPGRHLLIRERGRTTGGAGHALIGDRDNLTAKPHFAGDRLRTVSRLASASQTRGRELPGNTRTLLERFAARTQAHSTDCFAVDSRIDQRERIIVPTETASGMAILQRAETILQMLRIAKGFD